MQHEQCDEQRNPSEKTIMQQKESVQSMWTDMEADEPLIPSLASAMPSTNFPVGAVAATGGPRGKAAKTGNSKNVSAAQSGRCTTKPAVEAAKQRSKTMKDYKAVETGLVRAKALGNNILDIDALKAHNGDQDRVCECMRDDSLTRHHRPTDWCNTLLKQTGHSSTNQLMVNLKPCN